MDIYQNDNFEFYGYEFNIVDVIIASIIAGILVALICPHSSKRSWMHRKVNFDEFDHDFRRRKNYLVNVDGASPDNIALVLATLNIMDRQKGYCKLYIMLQGRPINFGTCYMDSDVQNIPQHSKKQQQAELLNFIFALQAYLYVTNHPFEMHDIVFIMGDISLSDDTHFDEKLFYDNTNGTIRTKREYMSIIDDVNSITKQVRHRTKFHEDYCKISENKLYELAQDKFKFPIVLSKQQGLGILNALRDGSVTCLNNGSLNCMDQLRPKLFNRFITMSGKNNVMCDLKRTYDTLTAISKECRVEIITEDTCANGVCNIVDYPFFTSVCDDLFTLWNELNNGTQPCYGLMLAFVLAFEDNGLVSMDIKLNDEMKLLISDKETNIVVYIQNTNLMDIKKKFANFALGYE